MKLLHLDKGDSFLGVDVGHTSGQGLVDTSYKPQASAIGDTILDKAIARDFKGSIGDAPTSTFMTPMQALCSHKRFAFSHPNAANCVFGLHILHHT